MDGIIIVIGVAAGIGRTIVTTGRIATGARVIIIAATTGATIIVTGDKSIAAGLLEAAMIGEGGAQPRPL